MNLCNEEKCLFIDKGVNYNCSNNNFVVFFTIDGWIVFGGWDKDRRVVCCILNCII